MDYAQKREIFAAKKAAPRKQCLVEKCSKMIPVSSKSGLCAKHYKTRGKRAQLRDLIEILKSSRFHVENGYRNNDLVDRIDNKLKELQKDINK